MTYYIVHVCSPHEISAHVVGPLELIRYGTVVLDLRAIVDHVVTGEKRCRIDPVVRFIRPVRISGVASIPEKAGCELEEPTVRDAVLVVITVVPGEDLPSESSAAILAIPSTCL